ncbi:MAG: LCP family protein [Acidimicrobiia bacterium]|nr:LCP family protein [Acidimicrobiia bacterium]
MLKRTLLVTGIAVAIASCSGAATPDTTTTTVAPTTTTTTTSTTTTTTTTPIATATVVGIAPDLGSVIGALYSWAIDPRNESPSGPEGLLRHLETIAPPSRDVAITAESTTAELPDGSSVGIVTAGDDLVLVSTLPGGSWEVVGARLSSLGAAPWYGEAPRFLLVLGSDARPGENQQRLRADSVHVVAVAGNEGSIVGFPRDSWVEGPDGNSKLTNVMAGRGPEVMLDTMRTASGLPLEGYIVTGFAGFTALVDDFGGITIDLPSRVRTGVPSWPDFLAGIQDLDGERALQLAVIRKTLAGGDFGRSFNHGLIMGAALLQVQAMDVSDVPGMLALLLEHTWTDLSAADLLTLATAAYELDPSLLTNMVLPGTVGTAGAASVVFLGDDAAAVLADLEDGVLDE